MSVESELIAHSPTITTSVSCNTLADEPTICSENLNLYKRKKLILDLDETLVHSSFTKPEHCDFIVPVKYQGSFYDIYVQKRPGVDQFLEQLTKHFEIFIFTASMQEYSVPIVKALMPDFPSSNILSRQHCRFFQGTFVKDLSIFNCQLSDIVIVDNSSCSYCLQPQNGIPVKTWTGDTSDSELLAMTLPFLMKCCEYDDVRNYISSSLIC